MKLKQFISSITLSLGISSAIAGDMGVVVSPGFEGLYAGLGTGFTTLLNKWTYHYTATDGFSIFDKDSNAFTGVLFTGDVGYGRMFNSNTYLGVKGSIYYTPIQTDVHGTSMHVVSNGDLVDLIQINNLYFDPIYNIDAVFGYQLIPQWMPFVEGGVSFANVISRSSANFQRYVPATGAVSRYINVMRLDSYKTSYNVGVGLNFMPSPAWVLSFEAVYNDLATRTVTPSFTRPGTTITETASISDKWQSVSVFSSVSYLFNI